MWEELVAQVQQLVSMGGVRATIIRIDLHQVVVHQMCARAAQDWGIGRSLQAAAAGRSILVATGQEEPAEA
jgi:hypothetical protein